VCKCRKRTNLFCFVHSKAVCENCVAEDHESCYVSSYIDWLTNSTYDPPLCPVCHHDVAHGHPLRLECLHLFHEDCLGKSLAALPAATPANEYCCPSCKHPVVPDKWPLSSGVGTRIALFLRKHPFGAKLLPAPSAPLAAAGGATPPATPLRAAMMGASGGATPDVLIAKTPKARSRKPNESGDVRLAVDDDGAEDEEDKYANKDRHFFSPIRIFLLVLLVLLLLGLYLVFFRSSGAAPIVGSLPGAGGGVGAAPAKDAGRAHFTIASPDTLQSGTNDF